MPFLPRPASRRMGGGPATTGAGSVARRARFAPQTHSIAAATPNRSTICARGTRGPRARQQAGVRLPGLLRLPADRSRGAPGGAHDDAGVGANGVSQPAPLLASVERRIRISPEGGTSGSISRRSTRRSGQSSCEPASRWHHISGTASSVALTPPPRDTFGSGVED
jgi:hypothetical protein